MSDSWLELSDEDRRDILQTAAVQLGRQVTVLEKDIWVCWVLQTLFSIPDTHPMAFKGGTSLSKVYRVIDRFSEDIDITLDYRHFKDEFDPFARDVSKTQIKKYSDRLKGYVKRHANEVIMPALHRALQNLPDSEHLGIEVDETGEKIWIGFPSILETPGEYIQSRVLVELGGRNVIDPHEHHWISPDVSELTPGVEYPASEVVVLSPERTFWEKATLIHVECHRNRLKTSAERLSRHWYDLVMLANHAAGRSAIHNRGLLEDVIRHKQVFFSASYSNYEACLEGKLRLLPDATALDVLQADYEEMVRAGMMYQQAPAFDDIMDALTGLEKEINTW